MALAMVIPVKWEKKANGGYALAFRDTETGIEIGVPISQEIINDFYDQRPACLAGDQVRLNRLVTAKYVAGERPPGLRITRLDLRG